jgi:hypothetical protein
MAINVTEKTVGKTRKLVIEMDIDSPTPSKSGLTMVVGSTRGNIQTAIMVDGKPITLGINAYIKP